MRKENCRLNYWYYLTGNFLNGVDIPSKKVMPIFIKKISNLFNH